MTADDLRSKRTAARISGQVVCQIAGISRAKLSDIERENITAAHDDLQRINDAIEQIIKTRRDLSRLAAESGLSLVGVRL